MASNFPNDKIINSEIIMNDPVSKSPDLVPIYFGVLVFEYLW